MILNFTSNFLAENFHSSLSKDNAEAYGFAKHEFKKLNEDLKTEFMSELVDSNFVSNREDSRHYILERFQNFFSSLDEIIALDPYPLQELNREHEEALAEITTYCDDIKFLIPDGSYDHVYDGINAACDYIVRNINRVSELDEIHAALSTILGKSYSISGNTNQINIRNRLNQLRNSIEWLSTVRKKQKYLRENNFQGNILALSDRAMSYLLDIRDQFLLDGDSNLPVMAKLKELYSKVKDFYTPIYEDCLTGLTALTRANPRLSDSIIEHFPKISSDADTREAHNKFLQFALEAYCINFQSYNLNLKNLQDPELKKQFQIFQNSQKNISAKLFDRKTGKLKSFSRIIEEFSLPLKTRKLKALLKNQNLMQNFLLNHIKQVSVANNLAAEKTLTDILVLELLQHAFRLERSFYQMRRTSLLRPMQAMRFYVSHRDPSETAYDLFEKKFTALHNMLVYKLNPEIAKAEDDLQSKLNKLFQRLPDYSIYKLHDELRDLYSQSDLLQGENTPDVTKSELSLRDFDDLRVAYQNNDLDLNDYRACFMNICHALFSNPFLQKTNYVFEFEKKSLDARLFNAAVKRKPDLYVEALNELIAISLANRVSRRALANGIYDFLLFYKILDHR